MNILNSFLEPSLYWTAALTLKHLVGSRWAQSVSQGLGTPENTHTHARTHTNKWIRKLLLDKTHICVYCKGIKLTSEHAREMRLWVSVIGGCFQGAANPAVSHTSPGLRGPLWPVLQWDSTSEVLSVRIKTALGRNDVFGELFVEYMAELIGLGPLTTQFLYTVDFPHWKHQRRTRTNIITQDRSGRFQESVSHLVRCYTVWH